MSELFIKSNENLISGSWILHNGKIVADEECNRIEALIKSYLQALTKHSNGWEKLYVNPNDSQFWELTYPQSNLHGGGPPQLEKITLEKAKEKYQFDEKDLPA